MSASGEDSPRLSPACIPLLFACWENVLQVETEGEKGKAVGLSHPGSWRQGYESTPGLLGAQLVLCGQLTDGENFLRNDSQHQLPPQE